MEDIINRLLKKESEVKVKVTITLNPEVISDAKDVIKRMKKKYKKANLSSVIEILLTDFINENKK